MRIEYQDRTNFLHNNERFPSQIDENKNEVDTPIIENCPFCGGPGELFKKCFIEMDGYSTPAKCGCRKCGIYMEERWQHDHSGWATKEDEEKVNQKAIAKWNRRMLRT